MSINWKVLALSVTLSLLSGCSLVNRIHPNLATRLVKEYPDLQHICDHVGGCQNVKISCTRYDDYGNSNIRNTTFWTIETEGEEYDVGVGWYANSKPDVRGAITQAISGYWSSWGIKQYTSSPALLYPHSSPCDKDCGQ